MSGFYAYTTGCDIEKGGDDSVPYGYGGVEWKELAQMVGVHLRSFPAKMRDGGFLDENTGSMIASKNTYFLQRLAASSLPPLIEFAMNLVGEGVIG